MDATEMEVEQIKLTGPIEEVETLQAGVVSADDLDEDSEAARRGWLYITVPFDVWTPLGLSQPKLRLPKIWSNYMWFDVNHFCQLIAELPDYRLLASLTLMFRPHPEEFMLQQAIGDSDLHIDVDADDDNNVFIYRPKDFEKIRNSLANVYSQLLRKQAGSEGSCFDRWWHLEPLEFQNGSRKVGDPLKAWTYLGGQLLAPDVTEGLLKAEFHPVLASLWGITLERVLSFVPQELQDISFAKHQRVASFLKETIRVQAVKQLEEEIGQCEDAERSNLAQECLRALDGQ